MTKMDFKKVDTTNKGGVPKRSAIHDHRSLEPPKSPCKSPSNHLEDKALSAVLSQNQHPIAYASRTLSETERRYNTTEKELLAVLWACQHFRPYIYGRIFQLETDHQPLTWLAKLKEPNAKLTRWRLRLQEYDYDIRHTKGRENKVADALTLYQAEAIYLPPYFYFFYALNI
ncbi:Retrovirus-related Pol polyprotein from transposon 17.6 [Eumeta japonica]|uniref:Retrovirus-related Pol polyprotein from transposon 17.6 n=1 Tax=Eumeta variegata TaxID=151549 RepID=A0A4C2A5N6_EUMVA|nr:Retrovirus-related Pol polyprotein from transposon 17.6 [Eumeta japonica]